MLSVTYKPFMLSVIMLNVVMLSIIMLIVITLNVVILSVIMLSVIMLSVVAPKSMPTLRVIHCMGLHSGEFQHSLQILE
jgi:predicted MPP superfamily phosphohydrolase